MSRIFASPGPIYEPEGASNDYWRAGRALFAAGFRAGELVHNSFSYHMTPGAFILESGAHAVGCTVFPGGTGQTEQQLEAMATCKPDAYTGTPSFLRILLEKAAETGISIGSLKKASVGGEACPPSLTPGSRSAAWRSTRPTPPPTWAWWPTKPRARGPGARRGRDRRNRAPGTGDPVPEGEVGELVVTTLNPGLPADPLRHRRPVGHPARACPTGRTAPRIKGWLGRADQTTKIKGMFVHPAGGRDRTALSRDARRPAGGQRRDGQRPHVPAGRSHRGRRRPARTHRDRHARRDQAARRRAGGAPRAACPTTAR
jgi:phenylacetate-CoA ligase